MSFHVNLNNRILEKNHGIYIARAGKESRLFDDFAEIQAIGPSLPGFRIDINFSIDRQPNLKNMLKRALAIRKWAEGGQSEIDFPEMKLGFYSRKHILRSRSEAQFISTLRGYFERAQKGDLVLIPPNSYQEDAIIAEFRDNPTDVYYNQLPRRYGIFEVPTRRYKILTKIPKRLLPLPVLNVLAKPNAFVQVGESNKNALYHIAYGSFVVGNEFNSRFDVTTDLI